ncbi:spermatogenesis-associated protein [Verticillium alfalfae VaMs.102]|uniref:Spermatogenesis-associated protein n=1 Tax=Verticillium alfalfae (strain VaMs.102 / ATCC MYA-4576 / FGSC 10136) TaxID=526221 RepID=C9S9W3_VERA1|nr:spermatogenesis-associated protein [Verticillium alfalfae VaMs.102]EEY16176.1 spermatogenesis-associated protein [Verticillium alfalfae VaMs.102]
MIPSELSSLLCLPNSDLKPWPRTRPTCRPQSVTAPELAPSLRNRADQSNSPYIQGQINSPVAWQLLDDEAVERAKRENKLIFLNIGFKACHSIDSFSHPECASLLNEAFVPVIVDREERPDLDTIYMNYVQAVNGAGGWPLNLFLTPELEPVFGGTYWPGPGAHTKTGPEEEEGVDFLAILKNLRKVWQEQEPRCRQEAKEVLSKLREFAAEGTLGTRSTVQMSKIGLTSSSTAPVASAVSTENPGAGKTAADVSSELDLDQLEEAYSHIAGTFDPVYGGFGLAPKFPVPAKLSFLLRLPHYLHPVQDVVGPTECAHATEMALFTLRKIRDSGLRDHVGGCGFARYSITPDWSIPHFEKLTSDNALLLGLYLDAWLISNGDKDGELYDVVVELADYFSSPPMRLPGGGFASSEAADSYYRRGDTDVREGAFHLWTRKEFDAVIGDEHEATIAATYWNILEHGNVEPDQDPNDEFMNQNIPRVLKEQSEIGKQFGISGEEVARVIASGKSQAQGASKHRSSSSMTPRLQPTSASPNPLPAHSSCGAFFATTEDAKHTILRLKDGMDTAFPSNNAVSVSNLFRLGVALATETYTALARETLNAFEAEILQYPWLFPGLLSGVVSSRLGGRTYIVVRDPSGADDETVRKVFIKLYGEARGGLRNLIIVKGPDDLVVRRNPALAELVATGKPGAYVVEEGKFRPCAKEDVEY